jgi:uncharacterized membrane protein YkoI
MNDKAKNVLLGVSALAAFALGGAAVAGAADDDSAGSDSSSATTTDARSSRERPQREDEELLTGETANRVREAALASVQGGTIERVETDADGHAAYEAHMLNADGQRVTVYVDEQFEVVDVESGR